MSLFNDLRRKSSIRDQRSADYRDRQSRRPSSTLFNNQVQINSSSIAAGRLVEDMSTVVRSRVDFTDSAYRRRPRRSFGVGKYQFKALFSSPPSGDRSLFVGAHIPTLPLAINHNNTQKIGFANTGPGRTDWTTSYHLPGGSVNFVQGDGTTFSHSPSIPVTSLIHRGNNTWAANNTSFGIVIDTEGEILEQYSISETITGDEDGDPPVVVVASDLSSSTFSHPLAYSKTRLGGGSMPLRRGYSRNWTTSLTESINQVHTGSQVAGNGTIYIENQNRTDLGRSNLTLPITLFVFPGGCFFTEYESESIYDSTIILTANGELSSATLEYEPTMQQTVLLNIPGHYVDNASLIETGTCGLGGYSAGVPLSPSAECVESVQERMFPCPTPIVKQTGFDPAVPQLSGSGVWGEHTVIASNYTSRIYPTGALADGSTFFCKYSTTFSVGATNDYWPNIRTFGWAHIGDQETVDNTTKTLSYNRTSTYLRRNRFETKFYLEKNEEVIEIEDRDRLAQSPFASGGNVTVSGNSITVTGLLGIAKKDDFDLTTIVRSQSGASTDVRDFGFGPDPETDATTVTVKSIPNPRFNLVGLPAYVVDTQPEVTPRKYRRYRCIVTAFTASPISSPPQNTSNPTYIPEGNYTAENGVTYVFDGDYPVNYRYLAINLAISDTQDIEFDEVVDSTGVVGRYYFYLAQAGVANLDPNRITVNADGTLWVTPDDTGYNDGQPNVAEKYEVIPGDPNRLIKTGEQFIGPVVRFSGEDAFKVEAFLRNPDSGNV